jgi:hypothetical protein
MAGLEFGGLGCLKCPPKQSVSSLLLFFPSVLIRVIGLIHPSVTYGRFEK